MKWYEGFPFGAEDRDAWHAAIREVGVLTGDKEAVSFVDHMNHVWDLFRRAGILVGTAKPPPEEREALYAELDKALGVS